jgi:lipoate-protein ligase A
MTESWRLLEDWGRRVPVAEGLSVDDMLPHAVTEGNSPPILHLYTFEPAAIVGRYQDIRAALKLDRCEARGIAYSRRSTGGGTVIMGPEVVALGLGVSLRDGGIGKGIRGLFHTMSRVVIRALGRLGVDAGFRPKNDIEAGGRKLAGLSASAEIGNAVLFHASILVDFDVELMLDIMNTPTEKIYDKGYNCFSERLTTIARESGRKPGMDEVTEALVRSFEEELEVRFQRSTLTAWEARTVEELRRERYHNLSWIFSHKHPRAGMGEALRKTPGGLLQVYLSSAGNVIDQVVITGDFFSSAEAVNRIESALKYTMLERDAILETIRKVWSPDMIHGVEPENLADAIVAAGRPRRSSSDLFDAAREAHG